jgi:hypothetical protein
MSDAKIAYWMVRLLQLTAAAAIFNQYGLLALTMSLSLLVLTGLRVMLSKEVRSEESQVKHIP